MTDLAATEATTTYDCKQPSCTNEARSRVGRYSYCDFHREQREAEQARTGVPASLTGKLRKQATLVEKVTELHRAAKLADKSRAEAVKATQKALEAKNEADSREQTFRALARELFGDELPAEIEEAA